MKISKKLFIGFTVLVLFAFIIGSFGILGMQRSHRAGQDMYEKEVIGLEYTGKAIDAFKQVRVDSLHTMIISFYDDKKVVNDSIEKFEQDVEAFEFYMKEINENTSSQEMQGFYDDIMSLFYDNYLPKARKALHESLNDIPDHAHKLHINVMFANGAEVAEQLEKLFLGMMDLSIQMAEQTNYYDEKANEANITSLIIVLIIVVGSGIVMALRITASITKPIHHGTESLKKLAEGDFGTRMEGDYKGALGEFRDSLNSTGEHLSKYLSEQIETERIASASEAIMASIEYASKIQRNLLPNENIFKKSFSDYSIIWKPRDVVGGDIYWIGRFSEGTVVCVCDCTGHGTPGAMLTMLVALTLETNINEDNYKDTAGIIWGLEQMFVNNLGVKTAAEAHIKNLLDITDGCDMAALYIENNGDVSFSSANTSVFVCDGKNTTRYKGDRVSVGEGRIKGKQDLETIKISAKENQKFYIASDGLYDQLGGENGRPFGYKNFEKLILENHNLSQSKISEIVWSEFEKYRGEQEQRDDVQLITFKP